MEKKYIVNYGTGRGNREFDTIEECFENVCPEYTRVDITIETADGEILYQSKWWGTKYDPTVDDEEPLVIFGDWGYYTQFHRVYDNITL